MGDIVVSRAHTPARTGKMPVPPPPPAMEAEPVDDETPDFSLPLMDSLAAALAYSAETGAIRPGMLYDRRV